MMSDGVTFIFKTLIKVPIYTFVIYFVFNCFTFAGSYFKMLGVSHIVEMTVIENNYLPENEYNILTEYISKLTTKLNPDIYLVDSTEDRPHSDDYDDEYCAYQHYGSGLSTDTSKAAERTQFGEIHTCGIIWNYKFILPLIPTEQADAIKNSGRLNPNSTTKAVGGLTEFKGSLSGTSTMPSNPDTYLESAREQKEDWGTMTIRFLYKVPGLKYYADMDATS